MAGANTPFPTEAQCAQPAASVDYLGDLHERLEVGELQRQLCLELAANASPNGSDDVEQALNELTHGPLLPAAELFASYANVYDLHEGKLLLLHYAGEAVCPPFHTHKHPQYKLSLTIFPRRVDRMQT